MILYLDCITVLVPLNLCFEVRIGDHGMELHCRMIELAAHQMVSSCMLANFILILNYMR